MDFETAIASLFPMLVGVAVAFLVLVTIGAPKQALIAGAVSGWIVGGAEILGMLIPTPMTTRRRR